MPKPFFSLVIVVEDSNVEKLDQTLSSILMQKEEDYEILIIDVSHEEEKLSYLHFNPKITVRYFAYNRRPSFLFNKGASLAEGEYLHFLSPGEYYLSDKTLTLVKEALLTKPDILYTGYVIRHQLTPAENIFTPLTLKDLSLGLFPSHLQSLWIQRSFFHKMRGFSPYFKAYLGFEFLTRAFLQKKGTLSHLGRVLVDYDYKQVSPHQVVRRYLEALKILLWHFGLKTSLFGWVRRHGKNLLFWSFRMVLSSFTGKRKVYRS